jgi:CRP/FNR family transcriptional regulator, cyclic AMP receptor protein
MMGNQLKVELSDWDIFRALSPSDQDHLALFLRPRSFHKNEVIFLKGEPANGLYLIRSGKVKICAVDRHGVELIFTFLSNGDLLGDLAILDGKPRSAMAIASDDTNTLYLDRQEFLNFLLSSPQASIGIIGMLCQRLRRISTQLEEVSFLDVAARIARNLVGMMKGDSTQASGKEPVLACTISQEELARIIGASRVMVNKVLNSFVDLGFISIARKRLTILNEFELNRIACYDGDS